MFRFFDLVFSFCGLVVGLPVLLVIFLLGLFDTGKEFYFTLQESPLETEPKKLNQTYINYGFNHIGLVANTIDKIEK